MECLKELTAVTVWTGSLWPVKPNIIQVPIYANDHSFAGQRHTFIAHISFFHSIAGPSFITLSNFSGSPPFSFLDWLAMGG